MIKPSATTTTWPTAEVVEHAATELYLSEYRMGVAMNLPDWEGLTEPQREAFRGRVRMVLSFAVADVAARETAAREEGRTQRDEESDALRTRLANLLTDTANALKGAPGPLRAHDWSDLPRVAADLRAELMAAEQRGAAPTPGTPLTLTMTRDEHPDYIHYYAWEVATISLFDVEVFKVDLAPSDSDAAALSAFAYALRNVVSPGVDFD